MIDASVPTASESDVLDPEPQAYAGWIVIVGVMARWLELLELGWVPVTVSRAMTAAAKMQDDEPVSGNVCL